MRSAAEIKERRLAIVKEKSKRVGETVKANPVVTMVFPGEPDVERRLEFNNAAAIGIFEDAGVNILTDRVTLGVFNPRHLTWVLYHGLKKYWPDVNKEALDDGSLFTLKHFPYIYERLAVALEVILPDNEDLDAEEKEISEEEKAAKVPLA